MKNSFRENGGGIVFGVKKLTGGREKIYYNADDTHCMCLGATRSGKSRTVVLPSIVAQALGEESIVCSDPKGELYQYTYPFLESLGYRVIALDFKNPRKSVRYNFLQPAIDAMDDNNSSVAIRRVNDIVESLVGEAKSEPLWNNGEKSVMAGAILAVVADSPSVDLKHLTSASHFIKNMCKMSDEALIKSYLKRIGDSHPAKQAFATAEISPARTQGSFYSSADSTLRLFNDPYIYDITCKSEFKLSDLCNRKTALFIILPDETKTYYKIASLFVHQLYTVLVEEADKRGGRLKRRVNFNLDEFGNFTAIPDFDAKLTVGGGRGIRFNIFLQSTSQLIGDRESPKYGQEMAKTIMGNCKYWIYLKSDDYDTQELISKRLGEYTCSSNSASSSYNGQLFGTGNSSSSYNLIQRRLLTPAEVGLIDRPHSLIISSGNYPAMMYAPDISQTQFNKLLGMGDKKHNTQIRMERENARKERKNIKYGDMKIWKAWEEYAPPVEDEYFPEF